MLVLAIIALIVTAGISYLSWWANQPIEGKITNEEYERRFTELVCLIDKRNPKWIPASLRELKRGYSYYWQNARAIAMLNLLEETAMGQGHEDIRHFILSCNKYRKKSLIK